MVVFLVANKAAAASSHSHLPLTDTDKPQLPFFVRVFFDYSPVINLMYCSNIVVLKLAQDVRDLYCQSLQILREY